MPEQTSTHYSSRVIIKCGDNKIHANAEMVLTRQFHEIQTLGGAYRETVPGRSDEKINAVIKTKDFDKHLRFDASGEKPYVIYFDGYLIRAYYLGMQEYMNDGKHVLTIFAIKEKFPLFGKD